MDKEKVKVLLDKRKYSYFNKYDFDIRDVKEGVLFMFASWSTSAIQLISLLQVLRDFPELKLIVLDIDDPRIELYKFKNGVYSNGWGETFLIKDCKIIGALQKYQPEDLGKLRESMNVFK